MKKLIVLILTMVVSHHLGFGEDSKALTTLSFSQSTATATYGYAFAAPTLTTTPSNLVGVTFSSSNEDVAIINGTGKVTIIGPGTTTITASYAGSDELQPSADASYTLTVDLNPEGVYALVAHNETENKFYAISTKQQSSLGKVSAIEIVVINNRVVCNVNDYNNIAWDIKKDKTEYIISNQNNRLYGGASDASIGVNNNTTAVPYRWNYNIEKNIFYHIDKKNTTRTPILSGEKFSNTTQNKSSIVAHPMLIDFDLTISSVGYSTFYIDYPTKVPDGMKAYIISEEKNNRLTKTEIQDIIPANTGVLLKANEGNYTMSALRANEYQNVSSNLLKGFTTESTTTGGDLYYKLTYGSETGYEDKFGFFWGANNGGAFTIPAFKAYLTLPKNNFVKGFTLDDLESGVGVVNDNNNRQIYDLFGRNVSKATKGIYVINGKKIIL